VATAAGCRAGSLAAASEADDEHGYAHYRENLPLHSESSWQSTEHNPFKRHFASTESHPQNG
jgi:hypothetical protein